MIYTNEYFTDKLSKLHPEITEKSLNAITKKGLLGINKLMRESKELILRGSTGEYNDWIKFFIFMTPEEQQAHTMKKNFNNKNKD